ncbi:hypothetical protein EYF80_056826 [Liparis tanakae]|uniref:Uncharacterized protein n=1 Tax=Liparis tanakae TaxID=230148 RepID=A0A4Z2EVM8_9TELE|nr:hypothetical protein EYF80_056826 [Liparis tanakae]
MSEDAEAAGKPALFGGAQGFCAAVIPQLIPCCFVFTWPSGTDRSVIVVHAHSSGTHCYSELDRASLERSILHGTRLTLVLWLQ